jgi:hypothetical protein
MVIFNAPLHVVAWNPKERQNIIIPIWVVFVWWEGQHQRGDVIGGS